MNPLFTDELSVFHNPNKRPNIAFLTSFLGFALRKTSLHYSYNPFLYSHEPLLLAKVYIHIQVSPQPDIKE